MKRVGKADRIMILALFLLQLFNLLTFSFSSETHIRVGVDINTPPFQFVDEAGTVVGMHIDMMNTIAAQENLIIEYVPFRHSSEAIGKLYEGELDIVLGAISKDFTSYDILESEELSSATVSMIVARNNFTKVFGTPDNLNRYKGAFELDSLSFSQALSFSRMSTQVMGSQRQLFDALVSGRVDAVLGIKDSMLYMLDKAGLSEEYAITRNYLSTVHFSILTRKDDRILTRIIGRSMGRLRRSDDYEVIVNRWIVNRDLVAAQERVRNTVRIVLFLVLAAVVGFAGFFYINRLLRKTVDEKTEEIAQRMKELEFESSLRNKLIEYSPEGIILLRPAGDVLLMNPQAKYLTGLSSIPKNLHISQLPVFREIWKRKGEMSAESSMPRTARWLDPHRSERFYRYQMHTLGTDQDVMIMVEDVTIEEQEKIDAFEADKSRSLNRIVAGISHEIKNPLTSIRAYSTLIAQQGNEKEFQESFAYYVPKEVDRINKLIESLINYARPVQGSFQRVNLKELIDDSLYLMEVSVVRDNLRFSADVDREISIYADRSQVLQVIINLLINSIDAVHEKIKSPLFDKNEPLAIEIRAKKNGEHVSLEIYDEGMGMNEEELAECMEPFFTTKPHGTGMGLALAKQFIQENNGTMSVESEVGKGTRITIVFRSNKEKS